MNDFHLHFATDYTIDERKFILQGKYRSLRHSKWTQTVPVRFNMNSLNKIDAGNFILCFRSDNEKSHMTCEDSTSLLEFSDINYAARYLLSKDITHLNGSCRCVAQDFDVRQLIFSIANSSMAF